jgi:hypothetical protein
LDNLNGNGERGFGDFLLKEILGNNFRK